MPSLSVTRSCRHLAVLLFVVCGLTACSEAQLALHAAKKAEPPPEPTASSPSGSGYYKIGKPYRIAGRWYYPEESFDLVEEGIASWYGPNFHGKQTANGEIFDENLLTAAHRTLQMPSLAKVTNLENGRSVIVRINDRGPFANDRIIDLSRRAAQMIDMERQGIARVRVEVLGPESIALARSMGRQTTAVQVASTSESPVVVPRRLFVQAASFSQPQNAQRLSSELTQFGNTAVDAAEIDGRRFYRVRIGPWDSLDVAQRALAAVVAGGFPDARLISE